jgi:hypothetical protein
MCGSFHELASKCAFLVVNIIWVIIATPLYLCGVWFLEKTPRDEMVYCLVHSSYLVEWYYPLYLY